MQSVPLTHPPYFSTTKIQYKVLWIFLPPGFEWSFDVLTSLSSPSPSADKHICRRTLEKKSVKKKLFMFASINWYDFIGSLRFISTSIVAVLHIIDSAYFANLLMLHTCFYVRFRFDTFFHCIDISIWQIVIYILQL